MTHHLTNPALAAGRAPAGLAAFAGRWSIVREIRHADGLTGMLEGWATVTHAAPGMAVYDEAGTLKLGAAAPMKATQRYLWHAARAAIDISFADGRPFHRLSLTGFRAETVHLCPPDRYAVAYDFTDWPVWRAEWRVEGPRKDYRMATTYRPATDHLP